MRFVRALLAAFLAAALVSVSPGGGEAAVTKGKTKACGSVKSQSGRSASAKC